MAEKTVSAESGSTFKTLLNLWPYMWPADRPDLRARVVWATLLLVVAKLTLVAGPYFFKWATDALAGDFKSAPPLPAFLLAPVMLVVAYNVVRVWCSSASTSCATRCSPASANMRCAMLAFRTFVHMHELSLRFHLERRTGGLSRIIERGTKGIETIVRFTMLQHGADHPRIRADGRHLRLRLWLALCGRRRGHRLALHLVHGPGQRLAHLDPPRDERAATPTPTPRRSTRCSITRPSNISTTRRMEAERFDRSMARYETAATRIWTSLGWLNFGQGIIFGLGMVDRHVHVGAARCRPARRRSAISSSSTPC